ncbi:hypothetical protein GCM10023196_068850 [Actinoallomurus vinaceus]|uniref:SecDF P1 head subdomain domain-containing protein n=1 Tax=Actinoallomurus vinaceus TaxID=1080074 RepID=A0ABP8UJG9_9ACTN
MAEHPGPPPYGTPENQGAGPYGPPGPEPYGPPGYPGPQPYAPPPYGPGPGQGFAPGPTRRGRGPLIAVVAVAALVLLIGAGTAILLLTGNNNDATRASGALKTPIRFQQVTAESPAPCSGGGVPDADGRTCYRLSADGTMTVTRVKVIRVQPPDVAHGRTSWALQLDLEGADAQAFAALSAKAAAAGSQQPGNRIAIVVGDKVVSAPAVAQAITGGSIEISGSFDEQAAKSLFRRLTGRTG